MTITLGNSILSPGPIVRDAAGGFYFLEGKLIRRLREVAQAAPGRQVKAVGNKVVSYWQIMCKRFYQ
jgi:hypothetical protein